MADKMTVGDLRAALSGFDEDSPVAIQGTSVAVYPRRVLALSVLRKAAEAEDSDWETWSFEHDEPNTVVIMTED